MVRRLNGPFSWRRQRLLARRVFILVQRPLYYSPSRRPLTLNTLGDFFIAGFVTFRAHGEARPTKGKGKCKGSQYNIATPLRELTCHMPGLR